jgi:hypothetical protein
MDIDTLLQRHFKLIQQQTQANLRYRLKNKEKINELSKKYYEQKKCDDEFKQKLRDRSKAYYYKKKAMNSVE